MAARPVGAEIAATRRKIANTLLAGMGGGILGGALAGLGEAAWMYGLWFVDQPELRMFWWGPLFYGAFFSGLGLAIGTGLVFVYLFFGRFRVASGTLALSTGATLAICLVVIGRFRYARDMLGERALNLTEIAAILVLALLLFVLAERILSLSLRRAPGSRRASIAAVLVAWALLIAGGAVFGAIKQRPETRPALAPVAAEGRPNIILIVADTLRADYLPVYSTKAPAKTPAIDAFARDAVVFKNSFSQAPWTRPSFGTLFTGRYPGLHGATGKASVMSPDEITLAEVLQSAGYYTQGFPNNRNLLPMYGLDQGFVGYDFLAPHLYFGASFSVERFALYEVLRRVRVALQRPRIDIAHFYRPAPGVNAAVEAWFDSRAFPAETPFFLYTHYMDPHDPYMTADQPGIGYSSMRLGNNPDPDLYRKPITYAYIDEIERLDAALGEFFADLKRRKLYDDSLIVFTSDHGEELYDHRGWSHGPTLYDEVTHVPIIIKFPRGQHAGAVNQDLARHIDLAPTMLRQAGITPPEAMNGIPLEDGAGTFLNGGTRESFAETDFTKVVATSVRTRDHKLIRANPANPRGLEMLELYDIQGDPSESRNLAGAGMVYEAALSQALDAYAGLLGADQ